MRRALLSGLVLALSACQDAPATAPLALPVPLAGLGAPVDKFVQRVPVSITVSGFCVSETLLVSGTLHVVTTVWGNADKLRIKSHLNGNLTGVGLSTGLTYRYIQVTNTDFEQETTTGASVSDQVYLFRVVSATSAPDYHVMMNGTYRYDPVNGGTFEPRQWKLECR